MQCASAKLHGRTFHYILTVQDIFSRYIWLRPLTGKERKQVAKELEELYSEVGPPKVLQCDNGGEFKKAVEHLCRKLEVKIIRSAHRTIPNHRARCAKQLCMTLDICQKLE